MIRVPVLPIWTWIIDEAAERADAGATDDHTLLLASVRRPGIADHIPTVDLFGSVAHRLLDDMDPGFDISEYPRFDGPDTARTAPSPRGRA